MPSGASLREMREMMRNQVAKNEQSARVRTVNNHSLSLKLSDGRSSVNVRVPQPRQVPSYRRHIFQRQVFRPGLGREAYTPRAQLSATRPNDLDLPPTPVRFDEDSSDDDCSSRGSPALKPAAELVSTPPPPLGSTPRVSTPASGKAEEAAGSNSPPRGELERLSPRQLYVHRSTPVNQDAFVRGDTHAPALLTGYWSVSSCSPLLAPRAPPRARAFTASRVCVHAPTCAGTRARKVVLGSTC